MKRWIIYKNHVKEGQASTWHKALDLLRRQEKLTVFTVEIITAEWVRVVPALVTANQYQLKLERI